MKRILVSVLSDYLQPNFLLIKEFEGKYDELVFISTEDMESEKKKKSFWLESALSIDKEIHKIIVSEDDAKAINDKLNYENFSTENKFIINLTGGTKVMSLAVYEFFKKINAEFFYIPIGKNKICAMNTNETFDLKYRINLKDYFTLHGLRYECNNSLTHDKNFTFNLYEDFKKVNFNRYNMPLILNAHSHENAIDRTYYAGTWFEEYAYLRLKVENDLKDDQICKSAKIFRETSEQNDNEIDVMFVKDNALYIFECKVTVSGVQSQTATHVIENYLYKLAAIAKDFGLRVNSYLLTLHKIKNGSKQFNIKRLEMLNKRRAILGIKNILDASDFKNTTLKL